MKLVVINVVRCPHGVQALSAQPSLETPAGQRLTGSKCCGRWTRTAQFVLNAEAVAELTQLLEAT